MLESRLQGVQRLVVLLSVLLAGCSSGSAPSAPESGSTLQTSSADDSPAPDAEATAPSVTEAAASNGAASHEPAAPEVTATVASWDQAQEIVARQAGKVVVLDLWSTACVPCIREFPGLVELQKRHPDDVVCISFNLDYTGLRRKSPESIRDKVLEFLKEQNAALINLVSSDTDEQIYSRLDLAAIPAVYVYDRQGALSRRFDNEHAASAADEFTYPTDIVPHVAELIGGTE